MAWERGGAHGAAVREEAAALPVHCGRKEKGGGDSTWWAGSATGPIGPNVEEDFFSDKN
jgi:hypothetical protein